jgi:biotin carboxyl carrier protein
LKLRATVDGRTLTVEVRGQDGHYAVDLDGRRLEVDVFDTGRDFVSLLVAGRSYALGLEKRATGYGVFFPDETIDVELGETTARAGTASQKALSGPARVAAPMPGKLVRLLVELGEEVSSGQGLVVVEAMKMENELRAPRAGRVTEIAVQEGQTVETGALLAVVE